MTRTIAVFFSIHTEVKPAYSQLDKPHISIIDCKRSHSMSVKEEINDRAYNGEQTPAIQNRNSYPKLQ